MKSLRLSLPLQQMVASIVAAGLMISTPGFAQTTAASAEATAPTATEAPGPAPEDPAPEAAEEPAPRASAEEAGYEKLEMEQLEQVVAPVALYPDELLAQVLPASTVPLDVVAAHQFVEREPDFEEPPAEAVESWDPAVVSLLQFKDVLDMMAGDVAWTMSLGQAFYFQESDVYDAIQLVRTRADAKGLLTDNEQQVYVKETEIIRIEPADPQVIYVPKYEPQVIYVEKQPAPTAGPDPFLTFVTGVAVVWGLSWAFDWGKRKCVHHHHWYQPWHHHHYHHHYGRPYYGHKPPPRPPSYRPPVRPPRPPGWRPPAQRPPGYRPPRPVPPPTQLPALRPDRPGARPPGGGAWRPTRPPAVRPPQRPGGGRPPLATPPRPTPLPATRPSGPSTRPAVPGSRPGTPTTRPAVPTKPTTRPAVPSKPTTRPAVPAKPTTRPGTPAKSPESNFKPATRPSAPANRKDLQRGSSSLNRSSGKARPAPTARPNNRSSFQPKGGSGRASSRGTASGGRRGR